MTALLFSGQIGDHEVVVVDEPLVAVGACSCGWQRIASDPARVVKHAREHLLGMHLLGAILGELEP